MTEGGAAPISGAWACDPTALRYTVRAYPSPSADGGTPSEEAAPCTHERTHTHGGHCGVAGATEALRRAERERFLADEAETDLPRFLVASGVDVNARDRSGKTALDYALECNDDTMIEFLRKSGARE